jgi:glutamine amidotransferase
MRNKKIVIVDYGHGNLFSINQACIHLGYNPILSSDPIDILNADSLILPGVGAFKVAMNELTVKNLIEPIREFVKKGNYLMGVCLGMQLLFETSEEFGLHTGLSFIQGEVKRIPSILNEKKNRVPHIGWNSIFMDQQCTVWQNTPLREISSSDQFYSIHSFFTAPTHTENILSYTNYNGLKYCSSVRKDNVFGFQFHPEKSAEKGLSIYNNFLKL